MAIRRFCEFMATGVLSAALGSTVGCAGRPKAYAEVSVVSGPGHRTQSNEELVRDAGDAVAVVETTIGRGLGFVVDPTGYIITNRHVIEDAEHIESVTFPAHDPPRVYNSVQVVYMDPQRDLALLKVNTEDALPRLPLAAKKAVPLGRYLDRDDPVLLLEYEQSTEVEPTDDPLEVSFTAHNAAVTDLAVYNPAAGPSAFVGIDSDVHRGQSGGPVLDRFGRVVGIVTWTWRDKVGGYAIPISDVMQMLAERPALDSNAQHRDRVAKRSREFLAALGRGDVDDARRLTSPSHARRVRSEAVETITAQLDGDGMPVMQGFFAAVESLVGRDDQFDLLREAVTRTTTPEFRSALALPEDLDDAQIISFFFELGQAYLIARSVGDLPPEEALSKALHRLQTVDAARTFAIADALAELAGSEVEIERVEVVPGAYTPTAVVSLQATPGLRARLAQHSWLRGNRLTLHMKLEWGDWYVASVGPTPLAERAG